MIRTRNRRNLHPERKSTADTDYRSTRRTGRASGTGRRRTDSGVEADGLDTRAASPARGISHEEKRRRQNRRDFLHALGTLALITLIGLFGYGVYRLTCVDAFIVAGSSVYSAEQIIGLSGLQTGKHILSYNTEEISKKISDIPNLGCTGVRKVFPNKISINVVDHSAAAAIPAANGTYTLIDANGLVLAIGAESSDGLVLLRGMANIGFVHNTVITEKNHCLRTVMSMKLLAAVNESDLAGKVTAIDVSNAASIKLELQQNYLFVLDDWRHAENNIQTAAKAYARLVPIYPDGGTVNIFADSTVVDFTPRGALPSSSPVPSFVPSTEEPQGTASSPSPTPEPTAAP